MTRAQARAVDTPFSNGSPSSDARVSGAPYGAAATGAGQPAESRPLQSLADSPDVAQKQSRERKGSGALVSTGSDEFDAFIDQEARVQRDSKGASPLAALKPPLVATTKSAAGEGDGVLLVSRQSPAGSHPSSSRPASYKSEDMLDTDESGVGDACGSSEQATACESPAKFGKALKGNPGASAKTSVGKIPSRQQVLQHWYESSALGSAGHPASNITDVEERLPVQQAAGIPVPVLQLGALRQTGDQQSWLTASWFTSVEGTSLSYRRPSVAQVRTTRWSRRQQSTR